MTTTKKTTKKSSPTPSLDELCAEAERAWVDRRDAAVVDRLAAAHPEHAAELYELFAALVVGSREAALPAEAARQASERTRRWLEEEGFDKALAAARRGRSFVRFLRRRTRESPEVIARRIGDVSWELLVQVSRYPGLVPRPVREELAARIGRAWSIPVEECLGRIARSGPVPRAASRRRPYPPAPATFAELLERSSLSKKERSYWAAVASR